MFLNRKTCISFHISASCAISVEMIIKKTDDVHEEKVCKEQRGEDYEKKEDATVKV